MRRHAPLKGYAISQDCSDLTSRQSRKVLDEGAPRFFLKRDGVWFSTWL